MGRKPSLNPKQRLTTTLPPELIQQINDYLSNHPEIKSASNLIEKSLKSYMNLLPSYKKAKTSHILKDLNNRRMSPTLAFIYWLDCYPELENKDKLAQYFPRFYKEYLQYHNQQKENSLSNKIFIIEDQWKNKPIIEYPQEDLKNIVSDKIKSYNGIIEKIDNKIYFLFKCPLEREEVYQFLTHIKNFSKPFIKIDGSLTPSLSLHSHYYGITS